MDQHGVIANPHDAGKFSNVHTNSGPSETDILTEFARLKSRFESWLQTTKTPRCAEILAKRGYLSTELDFVKSSGVAEAADRLVTYLKSIGAKASISQSGLSVHVRIPESLWKSISEASTGKNTDPVVIDKDVLAKVEEIKKSIVEFCTIENASEENTKQITSRLIELEELPINLDMLKITRVGVEVNKLSRNVERAKETLTKLKSVYLESKK
jgi:hypothetical protein